MHANVSSRQRPGWTVYRRPSAVAVATLLMVACSSPPPPPPLPAPRVVRSISHEAGGALAAGHPSSPTEGPSAPWIATLHLVALESIPDRGEPLVDHLRLISRTGSPRLLETRLELLGQAKLERFTQPAAAMAAELATSRATPCGRLRAALLPGTATVFDLAMDRFAHSDSAREGLTLRLARRADALEVALVARHAPPGPDRTLRSQEEIALLEPLDPARNLLLLVPALFDPGYEAYALALQVSPAASVADEHLAHQAQAQALRPATAPLTSAVPLDRAPAPRLLAAARAPDASTQSWSALAEATGATLTERLSLAGDPSLLEEARPRWQAALAGAPTGLGWRLEQASTQTLLESKEPLARPFLLERCGAVGAAPSALRDTLDLATSLADWERVLRQENRFLLQNAMSGVRARAFTWLSARGLAPADYDPFSSREARREALRKAGS